MKCATSIAILIRESAQFTLRGSNVRCDLKLEETLRPADIDEGQISQVLQNLIINADQAMPDGGTMHHSGNQCRPAAGQSLCA